MLIALNPDHWAQLRANLDACNARIDAHARQDARCVWLRAIIGIGTITADAAIAMVGNAHELMRGLQMAAWLGLVPTQHSTGGHAYGGEISCRGDAYLRTLLVQGACSIRQWAKAAATGKATPQQRWIRTLDVCI